MSNLITGIIVDAVLNKNEDGIVMKIFVNGQYVFCESTINENWLKIPKGKNAKEELLKVCDLLTGYQVINGERQLIPGFKHKEVNIVKG
jgi:hypothetical protein